MHPFLKGMASVIGIPLWYGGRRPGGDGGRVGRDRERLEGRGRRPALRDGAGAFRRAPMTEDSPSRRKAVDRMDESAVNSRLRQMEEWSVSAGAAVEYFQGPLPPPRVLKEYEETLPGAADRILTMADGEVDHRRGIQPLESESNESLARRGQIFGFLLAFISVDGRMILVLWEKHLYGVAAAVAAAGGLSGLFVWARGKQLERPRRSGAAESANQRETDPFGTMQYAGNATMKANKETVRMIWEEFVDSDRMWRYYGLVASRLIRLNDLLTIGMTGATSGSFLAL